MIKQNKSITIKRSQIVLAGYNPRTISQSAKRLLKNNLESAGLMGGIVWNKTTGHLVSGHQRISILDRSYKYKDDDPATDYDIEVVEVELTEEEEKAQNIFLNNPNGQGMFDTDKLKIVMQDINFSEMSGFDKREAMSVFGTGDFLSDEEYAEIEQNVKAMTDGFIEMVEKDGTKLDNYIVLIFPNSSDKYALMNAYDIQLNDFFFCSGEEFIAKVREAEGIDNVE